MCIYVCRAMECLKHIYTCLTLLRGVIILSSPLLQFTKEMTKLLWTDLCLPVYCVTALSTYLITVEQRDERWLEKTETHAIFQLNLNFFNFKSPKPVLYGDKEKNDQI